MDVEGAHKAIAQILHEVTVDKGGVYTVSQGVHDAWVERIAKWHLTALASAQEEAAEAKAAFSEADAGRKIWKAQAREFCRQLHAMAKTNPEEAGWGEALEALGRRLHDTEQERARLREQWTKTNAEYERVSKALTKSEQEAARLSGELEQMQHRINKRGGFQVIDDNAAKSILYDQLERDRDRLREALRTAVAEKETELEIDQLQENTTYGQFWREWLSKAQPLVKSPTPEATP